ncbi:MAG: homocitrate synthase [Tissierellia bacterium]|nr:homocitrate synthase [Tissierellia bacterium]
MKILENMPMEGAPYYSDKKWVSPMNFLPEVMPKTTSKKIYIHDVTLRDGEQTCGLNWTEDERVDIAVALNDLGVKSIEVGMPIISDDIVRAVRRLVDMNLDADIVAFCRARQDDIDYAIKAGVDKVIVEHAVNPYTNYYAYKVDTDQLLDRVISAIEYAKSKGLRVTFMGWDVSRGTLDYAKKVYAEVIEKTNPESIVFTDSFGVATPHAVYHVIKELKELAGDTPVEFHVHNEFGMAMGAVMAAAYAGVDGIHSSINGLGERTGNVATEEVAAALEILLNIDTGIKLDKIDGITKMVEEITNIPIHRNKPVTGKRLFWLESGVPVQAKTRLEQAGIPSAMTPYLAELVGRKNTEIVLGGSSGKENVQIYLDELELPYEEEDIGILVEKVKEEGRKLRRILTKDEFIEIYNSVKK